MMLTRPFPSRACRLKLRTSNFLLTYTQSIAHWPIRMLHTFSKATRSIFTSRLSLHQGIWSMAAISQSLLSGGLLGLSSVLLFLSKTVKRKQETFLAHSMVRTTQMLMILLGSFRSVAANGLSVHAEELQRVGCDCDRPLAVFMALQTIVYWQVIMLVRLTFWGTISKKSTAWPVILGIQRRMDPLSN